MSWGGVTRRRRVLMAIAMVAGTGLAVLPMAPGAATPPAPVILNSGLQNGGTAQWAETQSQPDDGGASVKQFVASFLVQHAPGRQITGVKVDANFDGADTTALAGTTPVSGQTYVAAAGGIETSRVTVSVPIGKPTGFSCGVFTGVRAVDAPVRMRVVDNTGETSSSVSSTVHFVEDANCATGSDFPVMTSVAQNLTEAVPGQSVTYSFTCNDPDPAFGGSDCDRANIRWRRLNDGATSAVTLRSGLSDNTLAAHTMSFPSRGFYVVEAQLGNEDGTFPGLSAPTGGWWRLGHAVINSSAHSLSGSIAFPGAAPSDPPSVNAGDSIAAVATTADADTGGAIELIEWDGDGNASFERREYTVPAVVSGAIVSPALTTAELTQAVNTSSWGLKTVNARVTDNGALDAADTARRQLTFSKQIRVNAIPVASGVNTSTPEDTPVTIALVASDADNQPAPLSYSIVSAPPVAAGSLGTISGNQVEFTPAPNFAGSTSFTYRVEDGTNATVAAHAQSNVATVHITVLPVNDAPTVDPKSATTAEDTPVDMQATGTDIEGAISWSIADQPTNGTAACNPTTGVCTYTPAPDFFGEDSFVVRGTDSDGASATATFDISVISVNDAPVADDQDVSLAEDSSIPITLTASDVDDVELTFTAPADDVDHGTLACTGSSCEYTPAPNYNGPDQFTFTVADPGGASSTGTVSIDVQPVNDAPEAVDVPDAETDEDVLLGLTLGGTDVDGDAVTVESVTDPEHGTATIQGANAVDYAGDPNFHGTDTFDFTITDGRGAFDTGAVVVTVHPVNDAPTIDDQSIGTLEDESVVVSLAAGDVDGDELSFEVTEAPTFGIVSGTGPDLTYTPDPNYFGADSFVVEVSDGNGGSASATISITVEPVNDAPEATSSSETTAEDTPLPFSLSANDIDDDADTLAYEIVTEPSNGTLTCVAAACEYTPAANFHGADLVVFRVTDPSGAADEATVAITITPVNDAPTADDLIVETNEDTPLGITLAGSDVDGDLLSFTAGAPSAGAVTGTAPDVVYEPAANYFGADAFTFTVSDPNGASDVGQVDITVIEVNDLPIPTDAIVDTTANTAVAFALEATDVDNDPITFSVVTEPESGVASCDSSGACTYTPAPATVGTFNLGFLADDGRGGSAPGHVTINVADVIDPTIDIRSPLAGAEVLLGSTVLADYDCADDVAIQSCTGDVADGAPIATSTPGPATFSVTAVDTSANDATAVVNYRVVYLFEGFAAPVDNNGVMNTVTAGSRVPMRWRVSGADGGISDPGSAHMIASKAIPCATETVSDAIEETTSTPGGLVYQNDGRWQYTWVTPKTWRNTCREFVLTLKDGTVHTALFSFR